MTWWRIKIVHSNYIIRYTFAHECILYGIHFYSTRYPIHTPARPGGYFVLHDFRAVKSKEVVGQSVRFFPRAGGRRVIDGTQFSTRTLLETWKERAMNDKDVCRVSTWKWEMLFSPGPHLLGQDRNDDVHIFRSIPKLVSLQYLFEGAGMGDGSNGVSLFVFALNEFSIKQEKVEIIVWWTSKHTWWILKHI